MKAWQVRAWGEPETMELSEVDLPVPGAHQVRIRNHAAGLNFFDILQVQGKYQIKPPFPFTPGAEVAGTVDAMGSDVVGFAPGDSVMALTFQGGFAEYSIAEAGRTFAIPQPMDFLTASTVPVVYQTSLFALRERAALKPGEWLLVHAGASGVGTSAIQIGKASGAHVIATAGGNSKLEFCLRNGADHAIDYSDTSWVDQVKKLTGGRGADVIYDPVGGDIFDLSTKCIAPLGRLLIIGFASGRIPSIQANRILLKNIAIMGAVWGGHAQAHPGYPSEAQKALHDLYCAGKIQPPAPVAYRLAEAPQALRDLANRKILGKAVLAI